VVQQCERGVNAGSKFRRTCRLLAVTDTGGEGAQPARTESFLRGGVQCAGWHCLLVVILGGRGAVRGRVGARIAGPDGPRQMARQWRNLG